MVAEWEPRTHWLCAALPAWLREGLGVSCAEPLPSATEAEGVAEAGVLDDLRNLSR